MAFRFFKENFDRLNKKQFKTSDQVDHAFKKVDEFIERYVEKHAK